jgi:hypothetical protein
MAKSCVPNMALARLMEAWLWEATGGEMTTTGLQAWVEREQLRQSTSLPPPARLPAPSNSVKEAGSLYMV